jgi:hypothetical protein
MSDFKDQVKKAVLIFIVLDLVFVFGALALFYGVFQPQMRGVRDARDEAVRISIATQARARAVEARYALTVMDVEGAKMAAGDVHAQLLGLAERIPAERTREAAEVRQLIDRAKLIGGALDVDPPAARKDLEVLEAKLAALYPAYAATPPRD